jgi:hypothetical protein
MARTLFALLALAALLAVAAADPEDGDVRLVNGTSDAEGRVEVFYDGEWGTVCDDGISGDYYYYFAQVICRQLGYDPSAAVSCDDGCFGAGAENQTIWLDNVECIGNETAVGECSANDWGVHNCEHDEDIAVICGVASAGALLRAAVALAAVPLAVAAWLVGSV